MSTASLLSTKLIDPRDGLIFALDVPTIREAENGSRGSATR